MDIVIIVQLVICVFLSIHVALLVLNIGVDAMVVLDAIVAAGHYVVYHVNIVKVIVILITQDSTYSSIFRAGNGK